MAFIGRLWLEEAVWLVQNDADFDEAAKTNVRARIMPVEIKAPNMDACIDKLEKMPAPRTMSTFLYHKFYKEELEKAKPKVGRSYNSLAPGETGNTY